MVCFGIGIRRKVAMVKSSKDNRYAIDSVVTHDGTKFPCWALPTLSSFKENFGADEYDKVCHTDEFCICVGIRYLFISY